jgi:hypothetical protein
MQKSSALMVYFQKTIKHFDLFIETTLILINNTLINSQIETRNYSSNNRKNLKKLSNSATITEFDKTTYD